MSKIGNHRVGLQETDAYRWGWDWAELGMELHSWLLPHLLPPCRQRDEAKPTPAILLDAR